MEAYTTVGFFTCFGYSCRVISITRFTDDFSLVVDFGIVVRVWRVWYMADMFMSPAVDPR